ncbi:MAG: VOC family protein [Melioribacteraceae bacterium]|nr:VOC family protein [Melioribacteraceae bacterium]
MTEKKKFAAGSVGWVDITVEDADKLKIFYEDVVGFKSAPVSMGEYNDFTMISRDDDIPYAGVCNNKGTNKGLPPYWLVYFNVSDIEQSCKRVVELGGELLFEPKIMGGYGKYCVIKDPAGAYCALFEPIEK